MTHTHILEPADSRLLYDGIRVLSRLLGTARKRLGPQVVVFHDHRRAAKRRTLEIGSRRGARRSKTYRSNRSVKRGSALIVRYFSVIELAGGFEYFVTGAGEEIAVGRW